MKITNDPAIRPTTTRKKEASAGSGQFQTLFEAEIAETAPAEAENRLETPVESGRQDAAWQTLEACVDLLDQAMQCLENGDEPPANLAGDIEQLRNQLGRQLAANPSGAALRQADTMLAVEAERIRNIRS